jgi:hypothetical protein
MRATTLAPAGAPRATCSMTTTSRTQPVLLDNPCPQLRIPGASSPNSPTRTWKTSPSSDSIT